eukprot:2460370-Alexandrium_andersonii.AAC.1
MSSILDVVPVSQGRFGAEGTGAGRRRCGYELVGAVEVGIEGGSGVLERSCDDEILLRVPSRI